MTAMEQPSHHYDLLIYQVPKQPSALRVGIWRELKRLGALYGYRGTSAAPLTA